MAIKTRFGYEGYGVRRAGSFNKTTTISGTLVAQETTDTAAIFGSLTAIAFGPLVALETTDTASIQGSVSTAITGTLNTLETADTALIFGTVPFTYAGIVSATETADQAAITGTLGARPVAQSPYPSPYDYGWYKGKPLYGRGRRGTG